MRKGIPGILAAIGLLATVLFGVTGPVKNRLLVNLKKAARHMEILNSLPKDARKFPEFKKKTMVFLRRSAKFSQNRDQKDYFISLITGLRRDNRLKCSLFPGNENKYNLLLFRKKRGKKCFPVILKTDPLSSGYLRETFTAVKELVQKGMIKKKIRFFPENILFFGVQAEYPGDMNKKALLYDYKTDGKTQYPMVFFIVNNIKTFLKRDLVPVSEKLLFKNRKSGVDFEGYIRAVTIHKLAHFLSPAIVKQGGDKESSESDNKLKTPKDELKENFITIEEARADAEMMEILFLLSREKYLSAVKSEKAVKTFVVSMIRHIADHMEKTRKDFLIVMNVLFRSGALNLNLINGKLKIDMGLVKESASELNSLLYKLEKKGKYEDSEEYIKTNAVLSDQLKALVKLL